MTRTATRLTRLVELARLREEHARHRLAAARSTERSLTGEVRATEDALRRPPLSDGATFRFSSTLHELGRSALVRAEDDARRAAERAEAQLAAWRSSHQELTTLERLDQRLCEAAAAVGRRREQRESDDLATTRRGARP